MSIGVEVGTDLLCVHRVTIGKLKSKVSNKLNASALAALPSILTLLDFNHSATDCPPMRKSARSLCGISIVASASGILESITPGMAQVDHTPHLPQGPPGSGPPVSFARSGITAAWDPKFGSLLELAEACDVPVRWSCRTGVCHTCMTGLIDGSITYNPEPLERPAPGNVLVCCSQPNACVTLDL